MEFKKSEMKTNYRIIAKITTVLYAICILTACSEDYVDIQPTATLSPDVLANVDGLDALLLSVYAAMDGSTGGATNRGWQSDHNNWLYGEIASDNALKGSSITDQPDMNLVAQGRMSPASAYMDALWVSVYEGVARANSVITVFNNAEDLSAADSQRILGEARFLRAHFHHYGRRFFGNLPYIDENVTDFRVPNDADIFSDIEADYLAAIENLPLEPLQVGRAHRSAAQASLARLYLDDGMYAEAGPLLDAIIASGRYRLFDNYGDNFILANEANTTNTEHIFQIQALGRQGSLDGRIVNGIAQLHGCCGFLQPSQNLVNAHKTDADGLPLLDTFNDVDLTNDQGIETVDPFTPPTDNLDPRLDYTVARRGIPFLDFEIDILDPGPGDDLRLFPGKQYVVDQGTYGPYRAKKFLPTAAEVAAGIQFLGSGSVNYSVHRYADILLSRAEVAVEENDLTTALDLVNQIRNRAKNGEVISFADGTPAANYVVEPYVSFPNQEFARQAVRFERRLELALEGFRWYDLVRWGIAEQTIMEYYATENRPLLSSLGTYSSDYMPIPSNQIDLTRDDNGSTTLTQNPGY